MIQFSFVSFFLFIVNPYFVFHSSHANGHWHILLIFMKYVQSGQWKNENKCCQKLLRARFGNSDWPFSSSFCFIPAEDDAFHSIENWHVYSLAWCPCHSVISYLIASSGSTFFVAFGNGRDREAHECMIDVDMGQDFLSLSSWWHLNRAFFWRNSMSDNRGAQNRSIQRWDAKNMYRAIRSLEHISWVVQSSCYSIQSNTYGLFNVWALEIRLKNIWMHLWPATFININYSLLDVCFTKTECLWAPCGDEKNIIC